MAGLGISELSWALARANIQKTVMDRIETRTFIKKPPFYARNDIIKEVCIFTAEVVHPRARSTKRRGLPEERR
jgi:hypothetical protein